MSDLVGNPEDRFSRITALFVLHCYPFYKSISEVNILLNMRKPAFYLAENDVTIDPAGLRSLKSTSHCLTVMLFNLSEISRFECLYGSRLIGKPTICIGENKGADQLRGNREADQRLCFHSSDSTIPLLLKSEISSF